MEEALTCSYCYAVGTKMRAHGDKFSCEACDEWWCDVIEDEELDRICADFWGWGMNVEGNTLNRFPPTLQLNAFAEYITDWREGKGFPMSDFHAEPEGLLGKLMLVVSEVGEAAEAVRKNDYDNFAEEIADAMIRIMDLASANQVDLEREITSKMATNELRPYRHGKRL